jgi:ABC-type Mn2+/Zn2+ transport system permease subunit
MNWLSGPWIYAFFRNGIAAAVLAGALCGAVGLFVILRRMSYVGHGLSHAIFGGAVVGYLIGGNFYVIGGLWGAAAALVINAMGRTRKIGSDAAIGIVTTASFALGIALISRGHHFTRNFEAALFGNILGVTKTDLIVLAAVALGVATLIFFSYKQLLFMTFDADVAPVFGVKIKRTEMVFSLALAATIVATMRLLGVTLIAATIVTPAVVARLSTDSFGKMLAKSTLLGATTGFVGMYASYYLDIASGATITLTATLIFVLALLRSRFTTGGPAIEQESQRA